jgi:septum formation protein
MATSRPAAEAISNDRSGRVRLSRIVLASASPRRYELLRSLGLHVDVVVSGYEEPPCGDLIPAQLAASHAAQKLRKALAAHPMEADAPMLAADTVVDLDGLALGKPRDAAQAARMLEMLSSRSHEVHTAFALAPAPAAPWVEECATTTVCFYPLTAGEIAEYVATGEPFDKAGGYGIQGRAASLVESVDGDFYTVVGLPLARVIRALRRSGFELPKTNQE